MEKIKIKINNNDNLVTIAYVFNVGSYNETKDTLGIAHFVEHLVFRGTTTRSSEEINRYIESLGGHLNAYTTYERTKFFCTIPANYWKEGLELLNDICFYNTIPEDTFDLEKNIVINELRTFEDDPQEVCDTNLMKTVFHNAFNRQSVGGTPKTVEKITRQQVIDYIDTNFISDNLEIIFTGKGNEQEIENYIKEILPETNNKSKKLDNFKFDIKDFYIEDTKAEIQQSQLEWAIIGPARDSEDYMIFDLITTYLGGNSSSILYNEIREKRGLVYEVATRILDFNNYSLLIGYASLLEKDIDKSIELIEKYTNNINITEKELEAYKNYIESRIYMDAETTFDRNEYFTYHKESIEERVKKLKSITLDDIKEVANKYFNNIKIVYSVVKPKN